MTMFVVQTAIVLASVTNWSDLAMAGVLWRKHFDGPFDFEQGVIGAETAAIPPSPSLPMIGSAIFDAESL